MIVRIWLDGVEQQNVLSFSTKDGWIIRAKMFGGRPVMDIKAGEFITETLFGVVEVDAVA